MSMKTHILSTFFHVWKIWSPMWETGRFGLYLGDSQIIWESSQTVNDLMNAHSQINASYLINAPLEVESLY